MALHETSQVPSVDDEHTAPATLLVSGVVSAATLGVAFSLLALGVEQFWIAFPVGFGGALPIATGLTAYVLNADDDAIDDTPQSETERALAQLRQRYARGDVTDAEFERRTERLLETDHQQQQSVTARSSGDKSRLAVETPGDDRRQTGGVLEERA